MASLSNKVLITGINGFTGIYLKKYLENKGFEVFGISNHLENENSKILKCDITNKEEVFKVFSAIQPNYIFHFAAISFVQHHNIHEIYNSNVIGTQNILDACSACEEPIKKIILASSASVYGNITDAILSENSCPNPVNHYGISKLAMEHLAKTYFQKLPIIITRPFNYTAPGHGEQFVVPKIAKAFNTKEKVLELGNLNVFREYNSIDFVCEVYFKLMNSKAKSEIVNIASGTTHSLQEIISLFEKESKHSLKIQINPAFVRKNEIKKLAGDVTKLNKMIDLSFKHSIDDVIKSFLNK
jgi:nucleoside-diphosphate-sugar epimerase